MSAPSTVAPSAELSAKLRALDEGVAPLLTFDRLLKMRTESEARLEGTMYGELEVAGMLRAFAAAGLHEGDRVLDVGCGAGRWLAVAQVTFAAEPFGVECVRDRAGVAIEHFGRERVRCQSGVDPDVWVWAAPRGVVMLDWAFTQLDELEALVSATASVEWVVRNSERPIPGFACEASFWGVMHNPNRDGPPGKADMCPVRMLRRQAAPAR